ncbi:MAG TPA: glycosyltransferase family 4 protein [Thermoleophilaceae bacterium]|jgi:glycosyltransferase involved in cell wall biosynthesis
MRVLALTNEFPLPLDRGGPVRFYGLARALAERHEVHLLALRRPSTTDSLRAELEDRLGGRVEVFERPPVTGSAPARWARALREGVPPWILAQFSRELERRAVELAPDVDVVVLLDDYAGIYAPVLSGLAPVVADKSNVIGWSIGGATVDGAAARLRRRLATDLTRRFERRYVGSLAGVVVTSEEEGTRLERLYGRTPDAVVPSAIELPAAAEPNGSVRTVGWLGSHEYGPNVDGLVRFATGGWEQLGRDGARLLVAGADPPARVRELERLPGVEVLGFVDDLDGFLAGLAAAVVPLWRGAGVKLKTLAFLGAGVPVAATPVALEGITVQPGRHCRVAERSEDLAAALQDLLDNREEARRMGAESRALVAGSYTWRTVGPRFRASVERLAASAS